MIGAALAPDLAGTEAHTAQPRAGPALSRRCNRARGRCDRRVHEAVALTPAEAAWVQEAARERGHWLIWFVTAAEGRVTARAMVADNQGGKRLPGELVA